MSTNHASNDNPAHTARPASPMSLAPSQPTSCEHATNDGNSDRNNTINRRVIVVNEALAQRLSNGMAEQCLPGATIQPVPAFLNALGELGRSGAAAVIVPIQSMAGMVAAGAKTMRRMAPHARLLIVADNSNLAEAERAIEHGFDAHLPANFDLPTLYSTWRGHPPTNHMPSQPVSPQAETKRGTLPDRPTSGHNAAPADQASTSDHDLGDVDLVEAILSGQGVLQHTAMRLLAARSGLNRIAWAAPDDDVPADHITATVSARQHLFGTLHAPPPAERTHLEAWAGWLARWLALEQQVHQLEALSMTDELTGLWNRRYFNRFLKQTLDRSARDRSQVTLMVFDIDDFKIYNDRYGHAAGDEILREAAKLMQSSVREHDVVARIGGDEFAVIFWDAEEKRRPDSHHPESVRTAANRFQQAICQHRFPKLLNEAPGTLTISAGLASFPWDGRTPDELVEKADEMAMQSKRQGKNAITFGPGALRQGDAT